MASIAKSTTVYRLPVPADSADPKLRLPVDQDILRPASSIPLSTESAAHTTIRAGNYLPALDGLRGLAILLVLLLHLYDVGGCEETFLANVPSWGAVVQKPILFGWSGVHLFFVLSGFLITGILYDAKDSSRYFTVFYARRVLRIFPIYYGALLIVFVLGRFYFPMDDPKLADIFQNQAWFWLYGTNIAMYRGIPVNCNYLYLSHFWSLAVEEHFYLVWPLVVFCLRKWTLLAVCIVGCALAVPVRVVFECGHPPLWATFFYSMYHMDGLLMGAMIALAVRHVRIAPRLLPWASWALVLTGPLVAIRMFLPRALETAQVKVFTPTLLCMFFGGILIVTLRNPQSHFFGRWMLGSFMRALGKYSYGLYVFHLLLLKPVSRYVGVRDIGHRLGSPLLGGLVWILLAGLLCWCVAYASWHLFEKQLLRLKKCFQY